jgi:leucine-zipper of insertion element IS481
VKLHRNAMTTPHMRALLVHHVRMLHWPVTTAAEAAGVARRTAYKWLARHRHGGVSTLDDRSSEPHRQPRRTQRRSSAPLSQPGMTGWADGPIEQFRR